MGAFGANSRSVPNSVNLLTLSSERSRNDCGVAKNSNADWNSELCYIVCPRTGVLKSSDDTLCNFTRGLSEQRRWENARQTASRHSASLPVNKLMFCSLPMTLSATSHGDFSHNVDGRTQRIPALCFTACPQTGVLWFSDDTLCNFKRGLSPQRRWEHARQTASRHSASMLVHEMVFCGLLMTLAATSHGDFPHNVVGSMLPV